MTAVIRLVHAPGIEISLYDLRGASDHTTCTWSLVIRAAGGTDDGWDSGADDIPTMTVVATPSELETLVRRMVAYGLFGRRDIVRPGGVVAVWSADTVYVTAVRVDGAL